MDDIIEDAALMTDLRVLFIELLKKKQLTFPEEVFAISINFDFMSLFYGNHISRVSLSFISFFVVALV